MKKVSFMLNDFDYIRFNNLSNQLDFDKDHLFQIAIDHFLKSDFEEIIAKRLI